MKTLKNIGWYSLAFLSFLMVYSFIQGVGLDGLKRLRGRQTRPSES